MLEDKRKALLMRDERLDQLQAISTIDILPSAHLVEYRNKLASLKTQGSLSEKDLQADPVPNNSDFRPINEDLKISASTKLNHIEDQLDSMVKNWTDTLLENLDDPTTKDSLGLLSASDRSPINAFIKSRTLPNPVDQDFVKALRQVLQGLVPIEISSDEVQHALFAQGSAATVDQIKQRLDQFITAKCRGQDISKVRIVLK